MERLRNLLAGGALGLGSLAAGGVVQAEEISISPYEADGPDSLQNQRPEVHAEVRDDQPELPLTDTQITILTSVAVTGIAIYLGITLRNDLKNARKSNQSSHPAK